LTGIGIAIMKSELGDKQNNQVKHSSQEGISLDFVWLKVHLDPLEILLFCLLFLPVGIMIRDAPNTTFEDAMKRVAVIMGAATGIRTFPTDKLYERLSISSKDNADKDDG
jgi:hypothetical protein